MQDGLYPYLVIEKRNNDFAYINIADLDIFKDVNYNSLYDLDLLLRTYTEKEIKDSIEKANVVPDTDIKDKRLLIKYGNYKLPVLTNDIVDSFNLYSFIKTHFNDKTIKNIFFNKLSSILKDGERSNAYKNIIDNDSSEDFIYSLNYLSYTEFREFSFYLYNYVAKKENLRDNRLKREKVND